MYKENENTVHNITSKISMDENTVLFRWITPSKIGSNGSIKSLFQKQVIYIF